MPSEFRLPSSEGEDKTRRLKASRNRNAISSIVLYSLPSCGVQARSASEFPAADITSAHPRPSQGVLNAALEQYAIDARTSLAYMSLVILIETPVFTRLFY